MPRHKTAYVELPNMNKQSDKYLYLAALGASGEQNTSHQIRRHCMSHVTCPSVKHITPLRSVAFLRSCEEMELWESAASIPELLKRLCIRQKQAPPARARALFEGLARRGWRAHARALPPWKTFNRGRKVKGWGRGRGSEGREGTGSGQGSEGRGEGRGEGPESSSTPDQKCDFWACRLWASGS